MNLDNLLVSQKDSIFNQINELGDIYGPKFPEVREILAQLTILQPLWNAENYGYKGTEICDRLLPLVRANFHSLHHRALREKQGTIELCDQITELRDNYTRF